LEHHSFTIYYTEATHKISRVYVVHLPRSAAVHKFALKRMLEMSLDVGIVCNVHFNVYV